MKKYLLDSDTVSDLYDQFSESHIRIFEKLSSLENTDKVYISVLTLYKFEYGHANAPDEKKSAVRKKIEDAQQDFGILSLSREGSNLAF